MSYWDRMDDAKHLSIIVGCGAMAAMVTAGILSGNSHTEHEASVTLTTPERVVESPLTGSNRLFGTVTARDGSAHRGYIRWDRNEGSWDDLLDATKLDGRRRSQTLSGIRFGHVDRIRITGPDHAMVTLRSGQTVPFGSRASDIGTGLRSLVVDNLNGTRSEFEWTDLSAVDFEDAPTDRRPENGRLYGTLSTSDGGQFTGYIAWDIDEIYSTDILDGDYRGVREKIPFGAIETIERVNSGAARVNLHNGESMVLRGTNDVNRRNSGITVSDPDLGQVEVGWEAFHSVRFHGATRESQRSDFRSAPITGTVTTESGNRFSGPIRWDRDEAYAWELLDGKQRGVEFKIEFAKIARIDRMAHGAEVTLRDGRTFQLHGSNDVDNDNRGIVIEDGHFVRWDDFVSLELDAR